MSLSFHAPLRWFNHHPLWRFGTVPVWGQRLRAPTFDRWLALRLHQLGLMGVDDKRFLDRHVHPGMTVVDIGANQGLYSLLFARLVGKEGRVFAFEPDDMLYPALCENVVRNGAAQVQTRHAALGAQPGTMTLYRSLLNSGDNRLAAGASEAGPRESVQIRVERLDHALTGQRVHFIKMDVQGWEMEVLRGMQGLLDDPQNMEMAIYFEYWPQGLREAGSEENAPLIFLEHNGFKIQRPEAAEGTIHPKVSELAASTKGNVYINLFAVRTTLNVIKASV